MGGATRFLFILSPSPLLHYRCCPSLLRLTRPHYHHHSRRGGRLLPTSLPSLSSTTQPSSTGPAIKRLLPIKSSSRQLHTQSSAALSHAPAPRVSSACPEFHALLDDLSACGYFSRLIADEEYATGVNLSEDFLRATSACLSFARERPNLLGMVSRRDLEVVVENCSPFLFKNCDESVKRMKSFLGNDVLNSDEANTVDLMRFLLSYASDFTAPLETNNLYNKELVESSVRNLWGELAKLSYSTPKSNLSGSLQSQFPARNGQSPRPVEEKIEMKRGDWNCPRCNFMNFARNVKCLECGEARPKRQLTGGEWECPQCDFFNYARNMVCLRCDCKRPGEVSLATTNSRSVPGHGYGGSVNKDEIESRLAANEEKAQRWFSKISQLDGNSDLSSGIADEDFPEIMPLRKGVNRFVVSTRKTPLERRLANAQYRRNLGNDGTSEGNDPLMGDVDNTVGTRVTQGLDDILGHSTADQNARADKSPLISSLGSSQYGNPRGSNSSYVPFVPLPADMFAKKPENAQIDERTHAVSQNYQSVDSNTGDQTGAITGGNGCNNDFRPSEKQVNQEIRDKENEQADKTERWFKRVTELDNVTDLASEISDEDFPEIMPMRKGENRFVINKKKDRSLTSPMYKRRVAMEQANNTNFLPYVPFPPDYFAKKNKPEGADSTTKAAEETSNSVMPGKLDNATPAVPNMGSVQQRQNEQLGAGGWNSKPAGENLDRMKTGTAYGTSTTENSNQSINNLLPTSKDNWNGGYSRKEATNFSGNSPQPAENQDIRTSWTRKSLEGSAVKEPDPLDMSEEAKAERWFRRVAQIKDISELSQIPDEDFPSIMPMRKGVNRFVVSKRKTPLERRLTSQQYRKNLPIVSSDPMKKESDSS